MPATARTSPTENRKERQQQYGCRNCGNTPGTESYRRSASNSRDDSSSNDTKNRWNATPGTVMKPAISTPVIVETSTKIMTPTKKHQ
jgi:hypothetical protein